MLNMKTQLAAVWTPKEKEKVHYCLYMCMYSIVIAHMLLLFCFVTSAMGSSALVHVYVYICKFKNIYMYNVHCMYSTCTVHQWMSHCNFSWGNLLIVLYNWHFKTNVVTVNNNYCSFPLHIHVHVTTTRTYSTIYSTLCSMGSFMRKYKYLT